MSMKNVTIAMSQATVDVIKKMVDVGQFPSRSEVIRLAIRDFLQNDDAFIKLMNLKINS